MSNDQFVKSIVNAIDDKRGHDILTLDMRDVSVMADYFVICDATSERLVQTIAKEVKERAEEQGVEVKRTEGFEHARWVLVDLGDVICHIFHQDERNYYNLEKLWGDAPIVSVEID
ncbi:ribosome-associated protein [Pelagirhabdus alkalitolerans]|uniref:Ribosomal silencing factor RsfS n=1 Tax=Pelagirhabdus alkalitolerans TaxID=1612202 RepID=A0A1G6HTQ9_9BACI|nr:ribosome silencing factor [Pelagirhabdus alkalitolerans]SDB97622.1 ribosome-associated protein [Pelagirhabdus alkalitolerans]